MLCEWGVCVHVQDYFDLKQDGYSAIGNPHFGIVLFYFDSVHTSSSI